MTVIQAGKSNGQVKGSYRQLSGLADPALGLEGSI